MDRVMRLAIGSVIVGLAVLTLKLVAWRVTGSVALMSDALESGETGIFFESPHRIVSTLEILAEIAPEAKVCVARELTKKFETVYRGKVEEVKKRLIKEEMKGEFVVIIAK